MIPAYSEETRFFLSQKRPGGWHYLCAFTGKLMVMRTLRFPLLKTILTLASVFQVQAQALYRPKQETPPTVPYYSCIRSDDGRILSDDPLLISGEEAEAFLKRLYPREYHTSQVQRTVGFLLIPFGLLASVSGLMFYVAALATPKDEGRFSFTQGWGGVGTYCTGGGIIAFCGGIVLMKNSGRTIDKVVEKYHSTYRPQSELSFRPTSNGVGLVLAF